MSVKDLITSVGSAVGSAGPATAAAATTEAAPTGMLPLIYLFYYTSSSHSNKLLKDSILPIYPLNLAFCG